MKDRESFSEEFRNWFRPIFLWGFGVSIFLLSAYSFLTEIRTGAGPSLLLTLLPLAVLLALVWVVASVLATLAAIGIRKRLDR